jgi:predicted DNA-binding transcriptional regulator AlpA
MTANVYLSEEEFSSRYGIARRTLQRWRTTGDGPAFVRFGARHIKYRVSDIEAWAAARTYSSAAAELAQEVAAA